MIAKNSTDNDNIKYISGSLWKKFPECCEHDPCILPFRAKYY
jgi:hypothetical protein